MHNQGLQQSARTVRQLRPGVNIATLNVVAKTVNATPCNKLFSDGLDLLVGSEESWSVLFPEKGVYSK